MICKRNENELQNKTRTDHALQHRPCFAPPLFVEEGIERSEIGVIHDGVAKCVEVNFAFMRST